jgi:hypothetical protein
VQYGDGATGGAPGFVGIVPWPVIDLEIVDGGNVSMDRLVS